MLFTSEIEPMRNRRPSKIIENGGRRKENFLKWWPSKFVTCRNVGRQKRMRLKTAPAIIWDITPWHVTHSNRNTWPYWWPQFPKNRPIQCNEYVTLRGWVSMHHVTKRYEISGVVGAALSNGGWVGQNVDFQRYLLIESPKFLMIFLIFHFMIFLF